MIWNIETSQGKRKAAHFRLGNGIGDIVNKQTIMFKLRNYIRHIKESKLIAKVLFVYNYA